MSSHVEYISSDLLWCTEQYAYDWLRPNMGEEEVLPQLVLVVGSYESCAVLSGMSKANLLEFADQIVKLAESNPQGAAGQDVVMMCNWCGDRVELTEHQWVHSATNVTMCEQPTPTYADPVPAT